MTTALGLIVTAATGCRFEGGAGPGGGGGDGGDPGGDGLPGFFDAGIDAVPADAGPDGAPLPPGLFVRELPGDRVITLDGVIDPAEWAGIPAIVLDPRSTDLFIPTTEYLTRGGRNSVGLEVRIAWKPDAYYVAVRSTDDHLRTDRGPIRQDDAVGLYLNLDGDADGAVDAADYELVLRARNAADDHELVNLGEPLLVLDATRSAARDDGGALRLEARVPVGAGGVAPGPVDLATIGVSVVRWDDDNLDNPAGPRSDADATYLWFVGPSACETCCAAYPDGEERPWCDTSVMTMGLLDGL